MSAATTIKVPADLPAGWTAERSNMYGVIITAVDGDGRPAGYVTVDEQVRNFELGIVAPRKLQHGAEPKGRGWKEQLYAAAIERLRQVIS